jgi:hypothetical protein
MSKGNEPTFIGTGGSVHYLPDRMTLRQWYAGMALMGICANPDISSAFEKQKPTRDEVR